MSWATMRVNSLRMALMFLASAISTIILAPYCEGEFWPDNKTGEHTLIIFSTNQPLVEAIAKLQKLVKDNVYI